MRPASVWRQQPQRYRLEAAKCRKCGKIHFPPRLICDGCHTRAFEKIRLAGKGNVVAFTVVQIGPEQFQDQQPYPVAIVELDEGVRLTCQISDADPGEAKIGMRVQLQFRKIQADGQAGVIAYGYKAVPAER